MFSLAKQVVQVYYLVTTEDLVTTENLTLISLTHVLYSKIIIYHTAKALLARQVLSQKILKYILTDYNGIKYFAKIWFSK